MGCVAMPDFKTQKPEEQKRTQAVEHTQPCVHPRMSASLVQHCCLTAHSSSLAMSHCTLCKVRSPSRSQVEGPGA